jgi:hypothetical protein
MPQAQVTQGESPAGAPRLGGVVESRIDAPHVLGDGPPRAAEPPQAIPQQDLAQQAELVGIDDSASVETLALVQAQAQQLSSHLRQQAEDLDAREARLQAQMALFDNEVRSARLLLAERGQALDERAAELASGEQQLRDQLAEAAEAESARQVQAADQAEQWRKQDDEFAARKQQLGVVARRLVQQRLAHQQATERLRAARRRFEREMRQGQQQIDHRRQVSLALTRLLLAGIEQRRAAIDETEKQLAARESALAARCRQGADELAAKGEGLALREQRLTAGEELLAEQQKQCQALQERLSTGQQEIQEARRLAEADCMQRRAELELALKQQQHAVEQRSLEVDSRRLALEQLQAEVRQMHRESIEMRLAAEELSAQLAGTAPPAAITSSIGRLRAKLADHFRLAAADLGAQRQELAQLQAQLAEQHERLSAQKKDLQQWLERRQDEIEQQAARLVCREQELDWQQQQIEAVQARWQQERQQQQDQIRELLRQLRRIDGVAA